MHKIIAGSILAGSIAVAIILCLIYSSSRTIIWAEANIWVLSGVLAATAMTFLHATAFWTWRHAVVLLVFSFMITVPAELCGIRYGFPFGEYFTYHKDLQPRLFGILPLFIPLSWFVLLYAPLVFLESIPLRSKEAPRISLKVFLAAVLLMVPDIYLDPLAVESRAWTWSHGGVWFGIPAINFIGWVAVGLVVYSLYIPLMDSPSKASARDAMRLRKTAFMSGVVLIGATLYCLIQRVELGWLSIVVALSITAIVGFIWHRWGGKAGLDQVADVQINKVDPFVKTKSLKNKVVFFKNFALVSITLSQFAGAPSETPLRHRHLQVQQ